METLLAWIHLADLHLRHGHGTVQPGWEPAIVRERLLEDVAALARSACPPDAILVPGDLAYDGRDYQPTEALLLEMGKRLGLTAGDM